MTVCIIGAGIMGIHLGYFLAEQGIPVDIYEASSTIGGLAGPMTLADGAQVDRFYHTILSSDAHLHSLCRTLGIDDQLRFKETKMSFYHEGKLFSMNNAVEFLKFPPLGWIDRFRLGLTILYAQFVRDWQKLEGVSVEEWLIRLSGRRTFENIWRPMLKAKFDGGFENVPATWIWSRLVRMKSTREGANQKEEAGYLIGGYITLLRAMAQRIEAAGGKIHLRTPVQEIVIRNNRASGICVDNTHRPYDAVVVTAQTPVFQKLIPGASAEYRDFLDQTEYLGIICPLLVLDRPLTGYWTVNITDDSVPFTGIIETTAYIDPQHVGGHHLVYLPKYTAPGSPWQAKSDDEIKTIWLENLKRMFPDFQLSWMREFRASRTRYVEPLHPLNSAHLIPPVQTPVEGLFLATTAQIYPALTNGESVSRHARDVAQTVVTALTSRAQMPL
jgi:protoporphyrinogen oxidase